MPSVMWFRRDLRLGGQPGAARGRDADDVLPLFVLDPALWGPAGRARRAYLGASLRPGRPRSPGARRWRWSRAIRYAAWSWPPREVGASRVHVAADYGPYGHRRDLEVEKALADAGIELIRTGSPYAVAPGRVTNGSGEPYKVFTPFSRPGPTTAGAPRSTRPTELLARLDAPPPSRTPRSPTGSSLPEAGEAAARRRWRDFLDDRVADYADDRDRPDLDGTSRMSAHLKWGEIHPRTMLADLPGHRTQARRPTARSWPGGSSTPTCCSPGPRPRGSTSGPSSRGWSTTSPADRPRRLAAGRTGYPIVDAGHAPAAGDRLDAQPGPDDRGQLPGQGPAPRVAARRPALHALAGRRRPGLQPARLAVGGRLRHRRRAVLPGLQPDHARAGSSTPTAPTCGAGCPSWPTRPTRTSPSPEARTATPRRSSTTPRNAARRWTGWEKIRR